MNQPEKKTRLSRQSEASRHLDFWGGHSQSPPQTGKLKVAGRWAFSESAALNQEMIACISWAIRQIVSDVLDTDLSPSRTSRNSLVPHILFIRAHMGHLQWKE
jgi:hypothetical protein